MSKLADRLDRDPEPWKPKPGDKLIGTVTGFSERTSDYGTYPLVEIETDTGELFVWHCFHTVGRNELAKLRPAVGDTLGVKYIGRDGTTKYERYRVEVERADQATVPEPDWDTIGDRAASELCDYDDGSAPPYDDESF